MFKIQPKTKQSLQTHETMNNDTTRTWELMAEEITPQDLRVLVGGNSSTPHDLVTPALAGEPYDDQDPTKDLTPDPT